MVADLPAPRRDGTHCRRTGPARLTGGIAPADHDLGALAGSGASRPSGRIADSGLSFVIRREARRRVHAWRGPGRRDCAHGAGRERRPDRRRAGPLHAPRLIAVLFGSNLIGELTAFAFGVISPYPAQPDDEALVLLLNGAVFVASWESASGSGYPGRGSRRRPIERWLLADRPPTEEERDLVPRSRSWSPASPSTLGARRARLHRRERDRFDRLAATAGVVALLGGVTSITVGYLLVERILRPLVARASPTARRAAGGSA